MVASVWPSRLNIGSLPSTTVISRPVSVSHSSLFLSRVVVTRIRPLGLRAKSRTCCLDLFRISFKRNDNFLSAAASGDAAQTTEVEINRTNIRLQVNVL